MMSEKEIAGSGDLIDPKKEKTKQEVIYLKDGLDAWFQAVAKFWQQGENDQRYHGEFKSSIEESVWKGIQKGIDRVEHQETKDFRAIAERLKSKVKEIDGYNAKHGTHLPNLDAQEFDAIVGPMAQRSDFSSEGDPSTLLAPFSKDIQRLEDDPNSFPDLEEVLKQAEHAGISAVMENTMLLMQEYMHKVKTFQEEYALAVKESGLADAPTVDIMPRRIYGNMYMRREAEVNYRLNPPLFITRRLNGSLGEEGLQTILKGAEWENAQRILAKLKEEGLITLDRNPIKQMTTFAQWMPAFRVSSKIEMPDIEKMYPLLYSALEVAYTDSMIATALDEQHIKNEVLVSGDGSSVQITFKFNPQKRGETMEKTTEPYIGLLPEWQWETVEEGDNAKIILIRK